MQSARQIHKTAQRVFLHRLRNTWVVFFVFVCVYLLLSALEGFVRGIYREPFSLTEVHPMSVLITVGFLLLSWLCLSPVRLTTTSCLLQSVSCGDGERYRYRLNGKAFAQSFYLPLSLTVRKLLWLSFTVLFPTLVLFVCIYLYFVVTEPGYTWVLITLICAAGLLLLSGLIVFVYCVSGYFLVPYLLVSRRISMRRACKLSSQWMRGKRRRLYRLTLSFCGWFLLCLLILPCIYVIPLWETAKAQFASEILQEQESGL